MKLSYAILGAGFLALAAAAALPTRPAVVASVDVEKVFATIKATTTNSALIKKVEDQLNAERDALGHELRDMKADLEMLKAGTPAYVTQWKKMEEKIAQMQAQEEYGKMKLDMESGALMRKMYDQLKASVAALAAANNIDYVLVDDTIAKIEPAGMQATKQQMALRRMLYANPQFDITAAVVAHMDAQP